MSEIHLISNAHIDPIWQWEWEEGAASTLSTFRSAADLCEEFDDFVFCHNEALLYRWIEEYEPSLFERIKKLVAEGKWYIMGGWYLQPDCNIPSGESMIRQIQLGHDYFREKFGVVCNCAVSFDAFGHNTGLPQILKKAGYKSYLFMRPNSKAFEIPADDFVWYSPDGSSVLVHRLDKGYNTRLGGAAEALEKWISNHPDTELRLFPWGVGNHGGGPSRKDIREINAFKDSHPGLGIRHSRPENFFDSLEKRRNNLPEVRSSLLPFAVGCYTSQIRIKQRHRAFEALLDTVERMMTDACSHGLCAYPHEEFAEVERDICLSEFHDILPGTSIQDGEQQALQIMSHGMEILTRLRARAFFALSANEAKAEPGEYPIIVYNPHPYPVVSAFSAEFMLADKNLKEEFTDMTVWKDGKQVSAQIEKERSSIPIDWRKKIVIQTELAPMSISRFDCRPHVLPAKLIPTQRFCFNNGIIAVEINPDTGLLTSFCKDGFEYLSEPACKLLVIKDNEDPWGMTVDRFTDVCGAFRLMTSEECARFSAVSANGLEPVRVIEDGDVRTIVEACFTYGSSAAVFHYIIPKQSSGLGLDIRLFWNEKDTMLKLSVPTLLDKECLGQGMFCTDRLQTDGRENVSQQWVACADSIRMLTVINNGIYGSSCENGELRLSLLRSSAYTAHPIQARTILPQDRFVPRIDQGEHSYSFLLDAGEHIAREATVTREALIFNEPVYALSFFPSGNGVHREEFISVRGDSISVTSMKLSKAGSTVRMRLYNSGNADAEAAVMISPIEATASVPIGPYEVKTISVSLTDRTITEDNLIEG